MKLSKIFKKVIAGLFISGFISASALMTLILSPNLMFSHSLERGPFTMYANQKIDPDIFQYIYQADSLIQSSE